MFDLLEFAVKCAEKNGASASDAFGLAERYVGTICRGEHVNFTTEFQARGIGLRVFLAKDGGFSSGFSYVTDLRQPAVRASADDALSIARVNNPVVSRCSLPQRNLGRMIEGINDHDLKSVDSGFLCGFSKDLHRRVKSSGNAHSLATMIRAGTCHRYLANSSGFTGDYESSIFLVDSHVKAWDGVSRTVSFEVMQTTVLDPEGASSCVDSSVMWANRGLRPKKMPEQGRMSVIVSPKAAAQLISEGLLVWLAGDRFPPFPQKSWPRFHPELSVVDDSLLPKGVGSRVFDDEGSSGKTTLLVRNGAFESRLHNALSAERTGEANTSNAFRGDLRGDFSWRPFYSAEPVAGPSNLLIKGSHPTPHEDLMRDCKRGLFVREFAKISIGQSGAFAASVFNGFCIENGELAHPITSATIRGDYAQALHSITGFGDDSRNILLAGYMSVAPTIVTPSLAFQDIEVK